MARTQEIEIHGTVAPGFEPVRAAFRENFHKRGELGAAFCAYHAGRRVVDLWAGTADRETGRPWTAETMTTIFSSTKGMSALAFLIAAERGHLVLDAPVVRYWPEFGQAGKESVTVRTLLNHRAGVVGFSEPLCIADFVERPEHVAEVCARQAPAWAPGSRQGYHGVTFGPYVAEVFRRATGTTLGRYLAEHVTGPLGADFYLGLPESERPRVAPIYPVELPETLTRVIPKLLVHRGLEGRVYRQVLTKRTAARAFAQPADLGARGLRNFNAPQVQALELPWANGIASARGLSRIYAALAHGGAWDGVRLVGPASIEGLTGRQSWTHRDEVLRKPLGFAQGFIKEELHLFSPNRESFGHPGAGGALGWADPKARLAMAYVMNRMGHHIRSPRALALAHALYRCVS